MVGSQPYVSGSHAAGRIGLQFGRENACNFTKTARAARLYARTALTKPDGRVLRPAVRAIGCDRHQAAMV